LGVFAVGSIVATFGISYYWDQIPGAMHSAVQLSRNLQRDHAPLTGAYYSGCNEARADGVAPLYADEPGYRSEMDGDSDGIACEPYR
jgi:hypothetical protein